MKPETIAETYTTHQFVLKNGILSTFKTIKIKRK